MKNFIGLRSLKQVKTQLLIGKVNPMERDWKYMLKLKQKKKW